jgi:hypothetical protein
VGRLRVGFWLPIVVAGSALAPSPAWSQAGFYLTPSVSVSESYDDNVFSTPSNEPTPMPQPTPGPQPTTTRQRKRDDFIFRGRPGVRAGYQSQPFTLMGGYEISGEEYAKETELNALPAVQNATFETRYLPDPVLTLSVLGGYLQSQQARLLNSPVVEAQSGIPATALEGRRGRSVLYHGGPAIGYDVDPLTKLGSSYDYSHTQQVGSPSSDTHLAGASVNRRLTQVDTADLAYSFRRFSFSNVSSQTPSPSSTPSAQPTPQASRETDSHVVTLGWTRDLTPRTHISLRGGPRFTEGSVNPEAFAEISYKLDRGTLRFAYGRTQATAIGQSGVIDAESFSGSADYELFRNFIAVVGGALYRDSQQGADTDVYSATLSMRYRLLEWLNVFAAYDFTYQDGSLGVSTDPLFRNERIYRNVATVGIEASQRYRVY